MFIQSALLHDLGRSIISEHHPSLEPLKIAFMFTDVADIRNGKVLAGRTHRATDRDFALHTYDFVISIARDAWDALEKHHQYALLDHFIAYMGLRYERAGDNWVASRDPETGRLRSFLKEPDVKEFEDVLGRHGAYTTELRSLLRAFAEKRIEERKAAASKKKVVEAVDPNLGREAEEDGDPDGGGDPAEGYPHRDQGLPDHGDGFHGGL